MLRSISKLSAGPLSRQLLVGRLCGFEALPFAQSYVKLSRPASSSIPFRFTPSCQVHQYLGPNVRPLNIISKPVFVGLAFKRGMAFRRIEVRSPLGRRLLKMSRALLKALFIFYGTLFVLLIVAVSIANYYVNSFREIPLFSKNPVDFDQALLLKVALYNELITKQVGKANEYYMVFLRSINKENGLNYETSSDVLSEYLTNEQIKKKGKKWYDLYVDVLIRAAIVKGQLGNLPEAQEFLERAKSFINYISSKDQNPGSSAFRNNGYRLLAKIYQADDDAITNSKKSNEEVESLLFESINMLNPALANIQDGKFLSQKPELVISRDYYNSVNELAIFYSKHGKMSQAFKIFLSNLIFLKDFKNENSMFPSLTSILNQYYRNEDTKTFRLQQSDIPLLKFYISEILWAKKQYNSSINWTKEALIESFNYSRQDKNSAIVAQLSVSNLINMYKHLNKNGQYDEKIANCEKVANDIYIPLNGGAAWKVLFTELV